jgi:hypothetical protein
MLKPIAQPGTVRQIEYQLIHIIADNVVNIGRTMEKQSVR